MDSFLPNSLSRRERQALDALYRLESATVAEVVTAMPEEVTYDAARAVLRALMKKDLVKHRQDGPRYVYTPAVAAEKERRRALDHLVQTFFGGSAEEAAAALVGMGNVELSEDAVERLAKMIDNARQEGR